MENFTHRDRQRRRPSTEEAGSPRRFPRQFGDRFERFGFPFDRDEFEPEYYTQFEQPHSQQDSTYQQSQPEQHPSNQSTYSQSSPNQSCPQTSNTDRCNLQQSSTFDLGQKQEPVNDRGQRSMSAPPSENTPNNQSQPTENMSQSHSHSETKSSNERIIPIHIEGRDEPVMPKNIPPSYSQQHHAPQPQPDRLFGKPTEHFTQFLPHERDARFSNNWNQGFATEEPIRQQRFQPQYASQKKTQEYVPSQPKDIPIPVQREAPVKHPEHHHQQHQQSHSQPQQHPNQQQRSASPQVPPEQPKVTPQSKPSTQLDQIQAIQKDVSALMEQVEAFTGKSKDKQYLYLDEMLTRNLIKLDNIDTQGQESIRSARKEAIKCIEKTIGILEAKAAGGSDVPKESADVPEETNQFPKESCSDQKESSDASKEMEVDEKPVEDKVSEQSTEEKNVVPMETETCSSQPAGDVQESMEVSEAAAGPVATSASEAVEKTENKEVTPDLKSGEQASESKVPEVETATENKKGTASEVEMLAEVNPAPDSKVIADNPVKQNEEENIKDQVPENPTTVDPVKVDGATENDSEEKKDKKDKKKGKKKTEKKEK